VRPGHSKGGDELTARANGFQAAAAHRSPGRMGRTVVTGSRSCGHAISASDGGRAREACAAGATLDEAGLRDALHAPGISCRYFKR
jgi:hypothetical protein